MFTGTALALQVELKDYDEPNDVILDKDTYINNFFKHKYTGSYRRFEDNLSLWQMTTSCRTSIPSGTLLLEQYVYNNRPDDGGTVGFLFFIKAGSTEVISIDEALTNPKKGCFVDRSYGREIYLFTGNLDDDQMVYEYYFDVENKELHKYVWNGRSLAKTPSFGSFEGTRILYGNNLCSDAHSRALYKTGKGEYVRYCTNTLVDYDNKSRWSSPFLAYELNSGDIHFPYIKKRLLEDCGKSLFPKQQSYQVNIHYLIEFLKKRNQYDKDFSKAWKNQCQQ